MFNEYKSGVYTNGKKIFELCVGVGISIRLADGSRKTYPPELTIYLGDMFDRQGQHMTDWCDKFMIWEDRERSLKLLKKSVYLGDLE